MVKNDVFEVTITDVNNLGYGVCRIDGFVVFVRGGVTGDLARIKLIKVLRDYAVALIEELIEESPYRTVAPCPSFGRCGGCSFLHLNDACEASLKESFVRAALQKEGLELKVEPLLRTENRLHYRNKAQYPLYRDENDRVRCGFYRTHSHSPVCAENCLLQPEEFADLCAFFCDYFTAARLSCYDEQTGRGLLRHLILRKSESTGAIVAIVVVNGEGFSGMEQLAQSAMHEFAHLRGVAINENRARTNVIWGKTTRVLAGDCELQETLLGKRFSYGPSSFFQVNREGAEQLFRKAREMIGKPLQGPVCDLYCGVGAVGQCVCPDAEICGVELNPEAVRFARKNAQENGQNAVYACMDASAYFEAAGRFSTVLVDPPRGGLDAPLKKELCARKSDTILYISCNPATLARDLKELIAAGYSPSPVTPVDLFPKTGHVETVVRLSRSDMNS